jgi:hypothetical protein
MEADLLLKDAAEQGFSLAPVLERLVFPRARQSFLAWLDVLSNLADIRCLIGAHYHAPLSITQHHLRAAEVRMRRQEWAPSTGSWQTLAAIDQTLLRLGVVTAT